MRRNERCGNGPRERPAISITFGPEICDDATSAIKPALRGVGKPAAEEYHVNFRD